VVKAKDNIKTIYEELELELKENYDEILKNQCYEK
jgi:hypothetical protein